MMISKRIVSKSIYTPKRYMHINVKGSRSLKRNRLLTQALEHYCTLQLNKAQLSKISVDIVIKRKLDNDTLAYCIYSWSDKSFKHFTIELLYTKNIVHMLKRLAHEAIHLKQYALGELDNNTIHRGHTVWLNTIVDERKIDYWDHPWEIEAYNNEYVLFKSFCDDLKYTFNYY